MSAASFNDGPIHCIGVDRIEVIDARGRAFTTYYVTEGAEIHLQDDGKTLKVFAGTPRPLHGRSLS